MVVSVVALPRMISILLAIAVSFGAEIDLARAAQSGALKHAKKCAAGAVLLARRGPGPVLVWYRQRAVCRCCRKSACGRAPVG
jgi:hypothetical protein